jgi:hypothetical protein
MCGGRRDVADDVVDEEEEDWTVEWKRRRKECQRSEVGAGCREFGLEQEEEERVARPMEVAQNEGKMPWEEENRH